MEAERWQQVHELVLEALEQPPAERAAILRRRCAGDRDLHREVASLVDVDGALLDRLDEPVLDLLTPPRDPEISSIGPYDVLRRLGAGGGGVVYLAERADGEYRKQVAIKLARHGLDSIDALRRFRAERQILAELAHPNIAELWEGGTTPDGRPYFVMEYVDGEPIDRYCRGLALPLRRRLEIFLKVCAAVETVHRNLIIHRDLKPSNVLVDDHGEPKLLDFGIAKILQAGGRPTTETRADARPMTPQYASPEQVSGGAITTATDVYGLGLVLFELLAEARPYELSGRSPDEARDIVCRHEPPRPSTVAAAAWRRGETAGLRPRELAGDLDAIVLKALRKEPERRYGTVERLSADLGRFLDGRPVQARRGSWLYSLGKLARRRSRTVASAAVLALLLIAFAISHELQNRRTEQALERAEAAAIYLAEMFLLSNDAAREARALVPREMLDRGIVMLAELEQQPQLRAELMTAVGRGYLRLGLLAQAEPLVTGALEASRELHGEAAAPVVDRLFDLAWLRSDQGRFRDAEAIYRQLLEARLAQLGERHPDVASVRNALAAALFDQGRYGEAAPLFEQALEVRRRELGEADPRVAAIAGNLAATLYYRGRYAEAAGLFRDLLRGLRRRLPEDDNQVGAAKINLAAALRSTGDFGASDDLLAEVLALHRSRPPTFALAIVLEHVATNRLMQGRLEEAQGHAEEAAALFHRLGGDDHPYAARVDTLLARVLLERGRASEAEPLLLRADAAYARGQSADHWRRAETTSLLGACLLRRGRVDEAENLLRRSHRRLLAQVGERAMATRQAAARLEQLEAARGRAER